MITSQKMDQDIGEYDIGEHLWKSASFNKEPLVEKERFIISKH